MSHKYLFLDDFHVASMQGISRAMHQPEKKGAVIKPVKPWEHALQTRCAPQWDARAKIFRFWIFACSHMYYLESADGINWDRPVLRQKMLEGSWENNIVTFDPQLEYADNMMENIVYDPDDPDDQRRFKGFWGCLADRKPIFSPDGIHWRNSHDFSLPSYDESNLSYDRQAKIFLATLKVGGPHGRSHNIWTSRDFANWELISQFHADDEDQLLGRINIANRFLDTSRKRPFYNMPESYNVDVYNLGLFRYEELYIGLPAMYHQTGKVMGDWPGFDQYAIPAESLQAYKKDGEWGGFHPIQLMCSRDLKNWVRCGNRQPFIDLSPIGDGVYDLITVLPPSSPIIRDDEIWFYYTGLQSYGGDFACDMNEKDGAICLAVLRRDGFMSLDAGDVRGTILTRALRSEGPELHVNVDAGHGWLSVEVLDGAGNFLAVSRPVTGDQVNAGVQWGDPEFRLPRNQFFQLKFNLEKARLYAFSL
jgi:hypothetical protein